MLAKKSRQYSVLIAATVMALSAVHPARAATHLNGPRGLAVDTKGNLYVANTDGNQVLIYNPNYVQSKTISSGMSEPIGVALDSKGNIYVANNGSLSVTQYSPKGVQTPNYEITDGINNPWAIAVDAIDDLYVSNNLTTVTVYALDDPIVPLTRTITPGAPAVYGIAVQGANFVFGSTTFFGENLVGEVLAGNGGYGTVQYANQATAMAFGKPNYLYVVNANGIVDLWVGGGGTQFLQLSFTPAGIAVDAARGRVYLSNMQANQIVVYSTSGMLLHTIE